MALRGIDPSDPIGEAPFRELQATIGRMERVLASVPSGLAWLDEAGRIKWCNDTFAVLAGQERLFLLGQSAERALPLRRDGVPLEGDAHPLRRALEARRDLDEVCEAGPADAPRVLRLSGRYAMHDESEGFLSVSVLDITVAELASRDLATRTHELREALAEHEAFTYSVAHDLRAPLRAINSFAQILGAEFAAQLPERAQGLLSRILASGTRMDRLITDLLAYSGLGRQDIALGPLELEAVVEQAVAALADEVKERGGRVTIVRPIPPAAGNAGLLSQAITNLISNGLKFSAPGSSPAVVVRGESRGGRTRLWVEDNGIGIEPRYHEQIFTVFQRLHTLDEYPGTGIGLAIVSRATARSGGTYGVESLPGAGSRFWIELPAGDR